jgi:hypothetical protein
MAHYNSTTADNAMSELDGDKTTGLEKTSADETAENVGGVGTDPKDVDIAEDDKTIEAETIGDNPKKPIPSELNNTYRIEGDSEKGRYFFKDSPDVVAFKDTGEKLITKSTATVVATSMVALAEAKNWESIKLSGSQKFRTDVWMEASLRGMDVKGYKPTEQDRQNLADRQNKIENASNKSIHEPLSPIANLSTLSNGNKVPELKVHQEARINNTTTDSPHLQEHARKIALRKAYIEMTKTEAIKRHPELEPLYKLEKAAGQFVDHHQNSGKFDAKGKETFITAVREKALEALDRGRQLPEIKERSSGSSITQEKDHEIQL